MHTPASSTDRREHHLTKEEKNLLVELNRAGRRGDWRQVQELFNLCYSYKTPMFNAYMTAAMRTLAYEKLCENSLTKDLATYNLAVKLYAKSGQADLANEVAQEAMRECGLEHTLGAARLVAAAEVGDFARASQILDEMRDSNVQIDNGHATTALRAVKNARTKTSDDAIELFQKVRDLGLKPDVGLCNSFLSSLEKPEVKDFQIMDDMVERFEIKVDLGYAQTYLRKLLFLGSSGWSEPEMKIHLKHIPDIRLTMALRSLTSFKTKIKMTKFFQTLERVLPKVAPETGDTA
eukprot:Skav228524  [mRNA]  locus=scaffold796:123258:124133:+ [translate_table: standard]